MTPDTTEAVTTALQALVDATSVGEFNERRLRDMFVSTAIAADRKALAEQGYVIVNKRDVRTAVEWLDEALIDSDMVEEVWNQVSESRNCLKKAL